MKIFQSCCYFFFTLLILISSLESMVCDTTVVHDENNCSTKSDKCHSGSENHLPPPAIPQAEAQSGLASIETAAAAVATSQNSFSLSTPFMEQKATIDELDGVPVAFGDFNNDHFVDLFFIANNGYSIRALMGKECSDGKTVLSYFGSRDCLVNWKDLECHFVEPIVNVVPSDFTGQNRLDLLVTMKNDNGKFTIVLAKGGSTDLKCKDREQILTDVHSEPFVLDYNGDMIMDFIVSTDTCNTFLWVGGTVSGSDTATTLAHQNHPLEQNQYTAGVCLQNLTNKEFVFAKPHSSAFLNLENYQKNMDSDIFLAGEKEIKYIYNVEGQGFNAEKNISYPPHKRGQSAFMDINYAGQMTHLIPVCLDDTTTDFNDCKSIGLMAYHQDSSQWINVLDSETANISKRPLSFLEQSFFNTISVPVTLRIGDLNYDGYPDFATTLIDISSGRTFAAIYLNLEDNETESVSNPFKRKFKLSWISEAKFSDNIAMVSLFDLYDNGRLVLLLTKFKNEKEKSLKTVSYDYYIDHRFYYSFIRVTVVTGRCTDKDGPFQCPKRNNETEQVALGSNPHGPNVCFAGPYTKQHSCSAQLTQSAHFALQFPYMIFGLGDILNVVSDLKVSIPNGPYASRMRQWEEDIPGSKLVIVPFQLDTPQDWYKRVYINMGIYSMISLVFLLGLGVILIVAIYFLHCRERKEDRKDHMEYKKHWL